MGKGGIPGIGGLVGNAGGTVEQINVHPDD